MQISKLSQFGNNRLPPHTPQTTPRAAVGRRSQESPYNQLVQPRFIYRGAALLLCLLSGEAVAGNLWAPSKKNSSYNDAMARGDARAIQATQLHHYGQGISLRQMVLSAVTEYENASELVPNSPEPHFRAAETINSFFIFNNRTPDPRMISRALFHWNEFERLSPLDSRLLDLAFRRSLAYTKLGGNKNYLLALDDYERILQWLAGSSADLSTIIGNAAELQMAVKNLPRAIELYQEAMQFSASPLSYYGLAMAYLRDDQFARANVIMQKAASIDNLQSLRRDSVFFIPEGEIHAYFAFGFEVLGNIEKAKAHNEAFLRALPDSPFLKSALSQKRRLEKASKSPKRRTNRVSKTRRKK